MSRRPCSMLAAITVVGLLTGLPLPAQTIPTGGPAARDHPSHLAIQGNPASASLAEGLLERQLRSLPEFQKLQAEKLAKTMLANPQFAEQVKNLMGQGLTSDPKNPTFQKIVEQILQGKSGPGHSAENQELARLIQQFQASGLGKTPGQSKPGTRPAGKPRPPREKEEVGKTGDPKDRPPPDPDPAADVQERRRTAEWAQRLINVMERSGLAATFGNSPAWKRMMDGLSRYRLDGELPLGLDGAESLLGRLGLDANWRKVLSLENWSLRPEMLPRSLPNVSQWLPSLPQAGPRWSLTQAGLPPAPPGGLWRGLMWVVLVAIVGGALWILLTRGGVLARHRAAGTSADGPAAAWRLGPWPVHPSQVHTPADLVRAFEYFSLLTLGVETRNWTHRRIAAALAGGGATERGQAALELAASYEQARYAPPTHPVPAGDLAAARRALCLLAGVPTP